MVSTYLTVEGYNVAAVAVSAGMEAAERVTGLRKERAYKKALDAIDAAGVDGLAATDPLTVSSMLADRALIRAEFGEHGKARDDFRRAAELDAGDPWLLAEAEFHEALAARAEVDRAIGELTARSPYQLEEIAALMRDTSFKQRVAASRERIGKWESSEEPEMLAAMWWARGVLAIGIGYDRSPRSASPFTAQEAVARARQLAPSAWRPVISELRLARAGVRAAEAGDEAPLIAARAAVKRARSMRLTGHPWSLAAALDYEEARIEQAAWKWRKAARLLRRALSADPGHQAAHVWLVYCNRMTSPRPGSLVGMIDGMLGEGEGPRRVVEPSLVAELQTERAALIEYERADDAKRDFQAALRVRPAMWFARRGLSRCLDRLGRIEEAIREAELALWLAELCSEHGESPPQLLVELARLHAARGRAHEARAEKLFVQAEEGPQTYIFAYQAHVAALRVAGRRAKAIATGARARAKYPPDTLGMGGVTMEVGYTHLQDRDYNKAQEAFEEARSARDSDDVIECAQFGIVAMYRFRRRMRLAWREFGPLDRPMSVQASHDLGWLRIDIGDYGGALCCFESAHRRSPYDPHVMTSVARAMRQLGRPSAALAFIEERLPEVPEYRRSRLLNEAGWIQLSLGDHERARDRFIEACRTVPDMEAALRGRMAAEWQIRKVPSVLEKGILRMKQKLASQPGFELAGVHNEAGLLCLRDGDFAAGHRYFSQALKCAGERQPELADLLLMMQANALMDADALADADACLARVEGRTPSLGDDPRCGLLRARWLQATGNVDGALGLYRRVHQEWRDSGHALLGMATAHFARGDYAQAEQHLATARAAGPTNVAALELLAWTLVRRYQEMDAEDIAWPKLLERAAELSNEALALEPRQAGAYECLGAISVLRSQFGAADAYTKQAVACDEGRAEAHRNRAVVHLRLANYDDAVGCLERALACRGPHGVTHLLLGFALSESRRDSDAIGHLRRAVAMAPQDPLAPDLLAGVLERAGDHEGAYQVLIQALATVPRPESARIHLGLARVLCAQAEERESQSNVLLDEALREADAGLRTANALPETRSGRKKIEADAHYHRGVVLHRRGQRARASDAFKRACRADPGHRAADRAGALLRDARGGDDARDRRVRRWGNALAAFGLLLAVGAVVLEFARVGWRAADFAFFPVGYVVAGAVVLAIVGAALPRLVGLRVGGQVEIRISEPSPVEPIAVTLAFERGEGLSAIALAGPGTMPSMELPHDPIGNPI
jgi:tetratricopeptide (TPR) repeat protein